MTEEEASQLKPGDKVRIPDGAGRTFTVSHIANEPFEHTRIWLQETGRFLIPSQAEKVPNPS